MSEDRHLSPSEEVKRLNEESENRTAKAFEKVVSSNSFGELLARVTENVVAINKIGTDGLDLVLRNLRLAGRQDITSLARQLARTEDKLEQVLQEVERLRDEQGLGPGNGRTRSAATKRARSGGGSS